MDRAIVQYAHAFIGRVPVLDGVAVFFASYFPYLFAIAFLLLAYSRHAFGNASGLLLKQRRLQFFLATLLAVLLASGVVAPFIHYVYGRARPFVAFDWESLFAHDADPSFPSNHATLMFTLAASMWQINKKWGYWLCAVAGITALGRVYSLVHYPTDVIFGALVGICAVAVVNRIARFT